jgi:hypothetical protein
MHKRMSRIFAALMFMSMIPALAFASSSRVAGLNVPGDYIKDYTGIYTYVSGVGSVGNLVYVEPNTAMGAVLGNLWEGRLGTWALHLRNNHPALGQSTANGSLNPSAIGLGNDPNAAGEAFDLMWGHKMGSGSLGLRVNRSWDSNEAVTTVEGAGSGSRNVFGLGAGFGFAMNANTDVEVSGLFQNRSFSNAVLEDDGGSAYQLAGRAMMKAGSNLMLMPVVKLYSIDLSTATVPAGVKAEDKRNGWQAGLAGNWSIGSDDLFVLGAQLANNTEKTPGAATTKVSETYYPNVFMGLETHVNSWLTLRFGAQNAMMYSRKADAVAASVTDKEMHFSYNMGAGVKAGSLQFDATLAPNFWNNPVTNTFNNAFGPTAFPNVTATYSF